MVWKWFGGEFGVIWHGLGWFGVVWGGLGWFGVVWKLILSGLEWFGVVWDGLEWFGGEFGLEFKAKLRFRASRNAFRAP